MIIEIQTENGGTYLSYSKDHKKDKFGNQKAKDHAMRAFNL